MAKTYKLNKDKAPESSAGPGEVLISRDALLKPLVALKAVAAGKGLMPVLGNVLIELGVVSRMFATDLTTSAVRLMSYRSDVPMRFLLPAALGADVLGRFEEGDVRLKVSETNIILSQERGEYKFPFADPEEFPAFSPLDGDVKLTVSGGDFGHVVSQVSYAVGKDESRYILTGLHLSVREGRIVSCGTDGHRMARFSRAVNVEGNVAGVVVPLKSIAAAAKLIAPEEEIDIVIADKRVQFSTLTTTIVTRTLEGAYPRPEEAIPGATGVVASMKKDDLVKALKRVKMMAICGEPLKFEFAPGLCVVSVVSQGGEAREEIECAYEGDPVAYHFQVDFIPDAVSRLTGEQADIMLPPGGVKGAVMIAEEDYTAIVMPLTM